MKDIDYSGIGKTIKKLRLQQNLTQEELADRCNISTSYLGYVERGSRSLSLVTAVKLANCLHVSLDTLILGGMESSGNFFASIENVVQGLEEKKRNQFMRHVKVILDNLDEL